MARKLDIGQGLMHKPVKYLTLATVAFFLFAGIAYACPGITFAADNATNFSNAMPGHDMGKDDCADVNIHVCQSVRDQMLSINAAPAQPAAGFHRLGLSPQPLLDSAAPTPVFYGGSPPDIAPFHPVFKLQLSYSYLVLRL
jgi:hypothetical protein